MNNYIRKFFGSMFQSRQTQQAVRVPLQHSPTSPEEWRQYWRAKGFPWRREPEIDAKRQEELSTCRAIAPDIEKGIYPFKGIKLSRADVEWLLATHENGRGPVDWRDESQRKREGLNLYGADLRKADLKELPLARLNRSSLLLSSEEQRETGILSDEDKTDIPNSLLLSSEEQRETAAIHLEGADLRDACLQEADLGGAHLEMAHLVRACLTKTELTYAHLQGANLNGAHLEEAFLTNAHLEGAWLMDAHLQGARLGFAQLEQAKLLGAQLEGANLNAAHLEGANLLEAHLKGAILSRAFFDNATYLDRTDLGDDTYGPASLADIRWGDVNVTVVNWAAISRLGDERTARKREEDDGEIKDKQQCLEGYRTAVRAYRQLAVVLESQGLNEEAARFAYRAQILQRKILWKQRNFWKWLGSAILALLAGYGYRVWRILTAYATVVLAFAGIYFVLGMFYEPHLSVFDSILTSITAFHGRVFSEPFLHPGEPQLWVTALEAVFGLVIEGVFIAMLIQRFFGK